ncbi:MAG: DUF3592 domain-containing protein [Planctomycetales bacterium]|nr:DUF3592 domain-containing protein [Planctomycetales bacterium]
MSYSKYSLRNPANLLALFGIGVIVMLAEWYGVVRVVEARNWSTAPGTIVQSDYTTTGFGRRRSTICRLRYRFYYQGATYYGTALDFDILLNLMNFRMAYDIHKKYPQGAAVTVTFDPDSPSNCVIDPNFQQSQAIGVGLSVAAVIGAGAMLFGPFGEAQPFDASTDRDESPEDMLLSEFKEEFFGDEGPTSGYSESEPYAHKSPT